MSEVSRPPSFPRGALIGAGAVVGLAVLLATLGRFEGPVLSVQPAATVAQRDLRFEDRADGAVAVFTADDGKLVDVISPGHDNFLRATLRGLAQQRKRESSGPDTPFRLTHWADGRLTLFDPVTRRNVELEAFGETNEEAFARLLTVNGPAQ